MAQALEQQRYTVDEYLNLELASETRSEYRNGEIISMTGGTPEHNRISGNLYIALSLALRRKPYEVFHVDQRLWISGGEASSKGNRNLYTTPMSWL